MKSWALFAARRVQQGNLFLTNHLIRCAGDKFGWPPILERVQEWTLLPPGEEIKKTVSLTAMHYETRKAGTYEFWAEYAPPAVRPADQQTLRERGIDFPLDTLTTSHLTFKTSQ